MNADNAESTETPVDPGPPSLDDIADRFEASRNEEAPAETPETSPGAVEAAAAPETPPETPPDAPQTPPEPDPTTRGLEVLAEQQRALRAEQEAWKAQQAQDQQQQDALEKELAEFRAFKTKLMRDDALGAFQDMGLSFDDLSRAVLEGRGAQNPFNQVEKQFGAQLQQTKQEIDARIQQLEALETRRAEERAFAEIRGQIEKVSPMVAAMGRAGEQAVFQAYQQIAQEQAHRGEELSLPPYETMIQRIEKMARDQAAPLLPFLSPQEQPAATPAPSTPAAPKSASPTLSNSMSATVPTRTNITETEIDEITDPRARADAIAARWALNNS